jgi:hypothetical protein
MKKASLLLMVVLVLGLCALPAVSGEGESHELTVEFVAFDAKAKTVTFINDAEEEMTVPVLASAMGDFKSMEDGDLVVLTCADDENGEHLGVSKAKQAPLED